MSRLTPLTLWWQFRKDDIMLKFKYVNNREVIKRRYRQIEKVAAMFIDHNRRCIKAGRFCDVYLICFK